MPHSLKAKLGGLRHKQIISDKDYDRLCKALETERERQKYFAYLDGVADGLNESRNDVNSVLDKIRAEIRTCLRHRNYQADY